MKIDQQLTKNTFNIKNYYPYLGIFIFLFSLILVYFFIFEPLSKRVKEGDLSLILKESELDQREKNIKEYEKVRRFNEDFPEKVAILDKIIIQKAEVEQFISQLEKIANDSGVKLPSIDPMQEMGSIKATLNISGSYQNLKKFIEKLENNKLIIKVLTINVSSSGEEMSFTIDIKTGT